VGQHTVLPGETLFRIAQQYGVTVDAIKLANALTSDLIYAGQVLVIPPAAAPAPPTPAPATAAPATAPPATTAGPPPGASMPTITSLQLSAPEVWRGETLTVSWTAEGADQAWLYAYPANEPAGVMPVATNGSVALRVSGTAACQFLVRLSAHNVEGTVDRWASVPVLPREPLFFNTSTQGADCALAPPATAAASQQAFEHGRLLWIEGRFGIYALFEDGTAAILVDAWTEGQPDQDPSLVPPAGLLQPVGRLGLAWRNTQWARERLGWAASSQVDYTAIHQDALETWQDVLGDYRPPRLFVQVPGPSRAGAIVRFATPISHHLPLTWTQIE
jgi:LysM repeat protein